MKRYPAHKNSGVKWLGEVPYEWSVKKLKYIASAIIGLTYSPSELSDETNGVLVLRASNIKDGQLVFEDVVYVNTKISEQLITREGDILVCSRSGSRNLIGKNAIITNSASGCTFGAFMTVIRSKYNYFLYYVFNSILFDFQAGSFLTSTINQLTQSNLNSFKIPLPPEKDQASIIGYLDYKTHRIDKLIKKKQNQVELLKEQRDAIINQAVTKGLDLNVKMKDSGVEWLGEIPEHWEVSKLKYVSIINPSKNTSTATNNSDELVTFLPMERVFEDGTYDNSLKKPTNELWNGFTYFEKNDVIVAKITPCFENGKAAFLNDLGSEYGFGSTEFHVLRSMEQKIIPKFFYYIIHSPLFMNTGEAFMTGAAGQKRVPASFVEEFLIGIPSIEEQVKIVDHIDQQHKIVDEVINTSSRHIELLKEYRTTLISDVVTGKIDVRDEVIP